MLFHKRRRCVVVVLEADGCQSSTRFLRLITVTADLRGVPCCCLSEFCETFSANARLKANASYQRHIGVSSHIDNDLKAKKLCLLQHKKMVPVNGHVIFKKGNWEASPVDLYRFSIVIGVPHNSGVGGTPVRCFNGYSPSSFFKEPSFNNCTVSNRP